VKGTSRRESYTEAGMGRGARDTGEQRRRNARAFRSWWCALA